MLGSGMSFYARVETPMANTEGEAKMASPPVEPMMQFFEFAHLREDLRSVSQPFGELAALMIHALPRNPERTAMLRKLLEAKDCAVRAKLYREGPP